MMNYSDKLILKMKVIQMLINKMLLNHHNQQHQ
jgi:hypothetical protein